MSVKSLYKNGDPYEGYVNRGDVYFDGDEFHMWAGMSGEALYNVGYANSADGATWTVIDYASIVDAVPVSEFPTGPKEGGLVLYPDPARTYFNVETSLEESGSVEILSTNGQVLFSETLQRGTDGIDVSGIPRGLYIVKVTLESEILTGKLVIE